MTAPPWLATRGELQRGPNQQTWNVLFNGSPQYRLTATPAKGKFTCVVMQSVNGRRIDRGLEYADIDAAISGGLEELRESLGW